MATVLSMFRSLGGARGHLRRGASTAVPRAFRVIDLESSGFRDIRDNKCAFVDKTSAIADFLASRSSKRAFLSRPRRFGKSTTMEVIAEMLAAGDLPLDVKRWPGYTPVDVDTVFGGLEAHTRLRGNDPDLGHLFRQPHFVIKIALADAHTGSVLMTRVIRAIANVAGRAFSPALKAEVLACPTADSAMETLIAEVPLHVPIAVLVDEFDAPIIADICEHQWRQARQGIAALRSLLVTSKAPELNHRIAHFIVTGVARFASVSLFAGANNFTDLSGHRIASRMLGFSEQEIRDTFPAELVRLGENMGVSAADEKELRDVAIKELARHFDGYCFDGKTTCFNPTPVLASLAAGRVSGAELDGASGYNWLGMSPSALLQKLATDEALGKAVNIDIADLHKEEVHADALLLQTGLLMRVPTPGDRHAPASLLMKHLRPPNAYACKTLKVLLTAAAKDKKNAAAKAAVAMTEAAEQRNWQAFAACMVECIAAAATAGSSVNRRKAGASAASTIKASASPANTALTNEAPYHSYLFAMLRLALHRVGTVMMEVSSSAGSADLVVTLNETRDHPPAVLVVVVGHPVGDTSLHAKLEQGQAYFNPLHASSEGAVVAVMAGRKGQPPTASIAVWDVEHRAWRSPPAAAADET